MHRRLGFLAVLSGLLLATPAFAEGEADDEQAADETTADETTGDETTGDETTGDETTGDETTGDETTGEEPSGEDEATEEAPSEPSNAESDASAEPEKDPSEYVAASNEQALQAAGATGPTIPFLGPAPLTFHPAQDFKLTIIGRVQLRATLFDGDDPNNNDPVVYGDPGLREGVSIRRARLGVAGIVGDCLHFKVAGGWDNRYDAIHPVQAGFRLVDAVVGYTPLPAVGIWGGLMRVPFGREATASSATLLFFERAMASEHMAGSREPGVQFGGALGPEKNPVLPPTALHWAFGVSNGGGDWTGDVDPQPRFAGRIRLDLGDDWDDRGSAWTLPKTAAFSLGGSASYNRGLDANTLSLGADLGFRVWRIATQAELLWASATPAFDTEGIPELQEARESLGWYWRIGVAIFPEYLELAFRIDGYNDNRTIEDAGDRMDIAVGLNSNTFDGRLRVQLFYVHRMELSDGHNTPNDSVILQVQGRL
jgi:hypothetical protein